MKNFTKKLTAIVLAMTLVLSMSGVAFADTAAPSVKVDKPAAAAMNGAELDGPEVVLKTKGKITTKTAGMSALTIKTIATANTEFPDYDEWEFEPYSYVDNVVTAPTSGWIWFDYAVTGDNPDDYVDVYLFEPEVYNQFLETGDVKYAQSNCIINASGSLPVGFEEEETGGVYAAKGKQFVLYMETPETNTGNVTVDVCAVMYGSTQRTLPVYASASNYMISSGYNKAGTGTSDLYYKVVPNKTGLMTVNLECFTDYHTTGTVTLYNYNKKIKLSNPVQYSSAKAATKAYFGVTKGKTYYLRVQNVGDTSGYYYPCYGIKYGMTAYTDRYLPTNAKALQLKKGANVTRTLFTANNATGTDVYKIYVPKTQVAKFTVNTQNVRSGNITVKVYKNGKQVGKAKTIYPKHISNVYTITHGTVSGKASKGTYYIKLTKGAKASGQYSIKYNK